MKMMSMTLAVALALAFCGGATAIEPTHYGKYGNPEEPATRPYKAFWRGLKAIPYQIRLSWKSGEDKAGKPGRVEAFRGLRRGVVEFGDSAWWGMAGAYPVDVDHVSKANRWIDKDRRVALVCDIPTTACVFALASGGNAIAIVFGTAAVTAAQHDVDQTAMTSEEMETGQEGAVSAGTATEETNTDKAEKRSEEESTTPYSGDMISKARRGRIADN